MVLRQPPAHRLGGKRVMLGQPDHFIGEKFERPARAARWRARASRRHQQRLFLARQFPRNAGARLLAQRGLKTGLHKAKFGPVNGRSADLQRRGDRLLAQAVVRGQQDLRALELAGSVAPARQRGVKPIPFQLVELYAIPYVHPSLPEHWGVRMCRGM